jgi:hypothetical protein
MKSIYFLRYFFSFCYFITIISLVFGGIGYLLNLFIDIDTMFEIPFSGVAHVKTNASFGLMGGESFLGEVEARVTINELVVKTLSYRLFALIDFSILITIAVFSLKYLTKLFGNLSDTDEWAGFFTRENYSFIKKVAALALIGTVYMLLRDVLFSWILLQDTVLFGEAIQFHPDGYSLSAFITVFTLFGAARIFKAAIEMKEESEFTI